MELLLLKTRRMTKVRKSRRQAGFNDTLGASFELEQFKRACGRSKKKHAEDAASNISSTASGPLVETVPTILDDPMVNSIPLRQSRLVGECGDSLERGCV